MAPAYEGHQCNWRPDFLLPVDGKVGFQVCEINSRFVSNGVNLAASIYKALGDTKTKFGLLKPAGDFDEMYNALYELFDTSLPIFLVQVRENSPMYEGFINSTEKKFGLRPRTIAPKDLRILPDASSKTGFALYGARPANGEKSPGVSDKREPGKNPSNRHPAVSR